MKERKQLNIPNHGEKMRACGISSMTLSPYTHFSDRNSTLGRGVQENGLLHPPSIPNQRLLFLLEGRLQPAASLQKISSRQEYGQKILYSPITRQNSREWGILNWPLAKDELI